MNSVIVMTAPGACSPQPTVLDSPRTVTDFNTTTTSARPSSIAAASPPPIEVKAVTFDIGPSSSSDVGLFRDLTEEEHAQLVEALQSSKDRIWLLKVGESMEKLIAQQSTRKMELNPATTYQRMLVHRLATFYKLQPESDSQTKTISVSVRPESRVPATRLSDVVPSEEAPQVAFQIMRRGASDKRKSARQPSSADDSDGGSEGGSSGTGRSKRMTIAEREAAYNEARSRIFMDFSSKSGTSASSSSQSLLQPSSVTSNAQSSKRSSPTLSEASAPTTPLKRHHSREHRRDSSVQSSGTPPEPQPSFGQPQEEESVEEAVNVAYPSIYDPANGVSEVPTSAYPVFASYLQPVIMPAYPYFPAPYAFQPAYGPPATAGGPPSMYYPPNPYFPQHPHYMWVAPPVAPAPMAAPQMASGEQHPQEASGFMPSYYPQMAAMHPMPSYPFPASNHAQSAQYQPHQLNSDGAYNNARAMPSLNPHSPTSNGRNGAGPPWNQSRSGQGIHRNAWSFGPGIGGPLERGRMGARSVSGTSNGSGSGSGSRTPLDDTASTVSSSTSSSSRATYTSVGSGRHPLPPRPDWAVGLSPGTERRPPSLQAPPRLQDFPPLSGSRTAAPQKLGGAWSSGSKPVLTAANADTHSSPTSPNGATGTSPSLPVSQPLAAVSSRLDEQPYDRPAPKTAELFDHRGKKVGNVPRQGTPTQNHRGPFAAGQGAAVVDATVSHAMARLTVDDGEVDVPSSDLMGQDMASSVMSSSVAV